MPPRPLMVKITCGAEAPERANQAWTVAATALAAGAEVDVFLTGEAVWFAVRDAQPDLGLEHATPVADLVAPLVELGAVGSARSAPPAAGSPRPTSSPGCTIAGAATFVERVLQPDVAGARLLEPEGRRDLGRRHGAPAAGPGRRPAAPGRRAGR